PMWTLYRCAQAGSRSPQAPRVAGSERSGEPGRGRAHRYARRVGLVGRGTTSCRSPYQGRLVECRRPLVTQRRVRPLVIEKLEIATDSLASLDQRIVRIEIDLFVLQRAPQPFDEDVIDVTAAAVHADLD